MRVVVTGATGLLGNNVVRAALEQGDEVVAVSRRSSGSIALKGLDVVPIDADLADWSSVSSQCHGPIDAVIHCAAFIHLGWSKRDEGMRVNVEGTRSALRLAAERGARCVHVSTVNTLAIGSQDRPADEETPGDGQIPCTYVVTKRAAEAEARAAIDLGQDVVITYPGFMLGPWDWKPSSGRMILDLSRGAPPLVPPGGCSLCDARDVAAGVLRAAKQAHRGGRYILAGENWTYFQLWSEIVSRFAKRKPLMTMRSPGRAVVGALGDLAGRLTGSEPIVNSAAIQMAAQFHWYSSQRAIEALGYTPRPGAQAIDDAIVWFREHGYLP
jgi:dihydroflavonol-4-reductase